METWSSAKIRKDTINVRTDFDFKGGGLIQR